MLHPEKLHSDNELLTSFRHGKEKGFDHFFKSYYKAVYFFANCYVDDKAAAEDIASEAFIQLWRNRENINSESHLRNYLYRATANLCFDHKQRSKRKDRYLRVVKHDNDWEENDYYKKITRVEMMRQVEQAVETLPEQCRRIFTKLYLEGKSVKETAAELGLSISTINNQKSRGIKLLKAKFFMFCVCLLSSYIFFS